MGGASRYCVRANSLVISASVNGGRGIMDTSNTRGLNTWGVHHLTQVGVQQVRLLLVLVQDHCSKTRHLIHSCRISIIC